MPAIINPGRQRTTLDELGQALGIASQVFGIAMNAKQRTQAGEIAKAKEARLAGDASASLALQERKDEGIVTRGEELEFFRKGNLLPAKAADQGAFMIAKDESGIPIFGKRPDKTATPQFGLQKERFAFDQEKESRRIDSDINKSVLTATKEYAKSKVPEMMQSLRKIDSLIGEEGDDIPGVGQTALIGDLSGNTLLSQEGKDVRAAIATFRNAIIKANAGTNVTDNELQRLQEQVGTGIFKTDADLRTGLRNAKAILKNAIVNTEKGMTDDALTRFRGKANSITSEDPLFDDHSVSSLAADDIEIPGVGATNLQALQEELKRRQEIKGTAGQ